jgi:hypothetical protein
MGDFIDMWTSRLVEQCREGGLDEERARQLVEEIYHSATLFEVGSYEEEVAQREAEREE